MQKISKNKGITLIALIVTIIILMILAGVVIATINGNNGILGKAKFARDKYQNSVNEEKEKINNYENEIDKTKVEISSSRDNNENSIYQLSKTVDETVSGNLPIFKYKVKDGGIVNIQGYVKADKAYNLDVPIYLNDEMIYYSGCTYSTESFAESGCNIHITRKLNSGDIITIGKINASYANPNIRICLYSNVELEKIK